ncbi:lycopene cyclase domain-containing protein [uncultured Microbacterium sp.]|uniref:lycopene cyclase domain-containing protein n=1 Tax=uncultured Microbacterium sp. TaxID=191216 RepID=UPI0025D00EC0|nr:lycopene cyclase domain-containing protein [uncultured Microbacterium sp.]
MNILYLGLLLVSILCVGLVDARWRLFLWADPRRALLVLAVGLAFLLLWDGVGIATGIFSREGNPISTGILLAPHLPVEEPVFLLFLVQVTMVLYTGSRRILQTRAERRS